MRKILLLLWVCLIAPRVVMAAGCAADAWVVADSLRLREAPTTESGIVGILNSQTELMILRRTEANDWLYVRAPDGAYGWVSAEFTQVSVDLATIPTEAGILPLAVVEHVREIFMQPHPLTPSPQAEMGKDGESLVEILSTNNIANVFSKVGDSITVAHHFLEPIGEGLYDLGEYGDLQAAIDYYEADSFSQISMAAGIGWTTAAVLSARFADPERCNEGEIPLECEYRRTKPAVALIMFGTNDVSHLEPDTFCANMRKITQISIDRGIIPVLSTIPNRVGEEEAVARFNQIVVTVAREYTVPLWDYGAAMRDLPDGGLDIDGAHPSIPPAGYDGAADFRANNLYYGYVIRNLTALQMLDAVRRAVTS